MKEAEKVWQEKHLSNEDLDRMLAEEA